MKTQAHATVRRLATRIHTMCFVTSGSPKSGVPVHQIPRTRTTSPNAKVADGCCHLTRSQAKDEPSNPRGDSTPRLVRRNAKFHAIQNFAYRPSHRRVLF